MANQNENRTKNELGKYKIEHQVPIQGEHIVSWVRNYFNSDHSVTRTKLTNIWTCA